MKKLLILIIIIILCALPTTALANSAWRYPEDNHVLIDDCTNVSSVQIWGYDKNNNYCEIEWSESFNTRSIGQLGIYFDNYKLKNFQLIITFTDGKEVASNLVNIFEYGNYIYTVKDNTLKAGGNNMWKPNSLTIIFGSLELLFPLLFTVLVEWLVSLAFRLKPGKYVVIINFITNPVMNILLMLIFINVVIDFYLTLIILEAAVAGAEFWYYTRKLKGYTKKRLLLFTVTANLASWFLYWFLSPLLH